MITGGSVSVTFDLDYAQAVSVDHAGVFTLLPVEIIDNSTGAVSIGGSALAEGVGDDEYVCLWRILFRGDASVDEVAHEAGPYDMALNAASGPSDFALVGVGNVGGDIQSAPGVVEHNGRHEKCSTTNSSRCWRGIGRNPCGRLTCS